MIILEDLPVEERLRLLQRSKKEEPDNSKDYFYHVLYKNSFFTGNELFTETQVENEIKIKSLPFSGKGMLLDTEVIKNNILQGLDFYPESYTEMIMKMAEIRNHMICQIDEYGIVRKILNMDELQKKWQSLKKYIQSATGLLPPEIPPKEIQNILSAGDKEYFSRGNNITEEINRNIVFLSLFSSFIKKDISIQRSVNSFILDNQEIIIYLEGKKEKEWYTLLSDSYDMDRSSYRKAFEKNYFMFPQPFKTHSIEMFVRNIQDKENGWLESGKFTVNENVNDMLRVSVLGEIKRIKDHE